MEAAAGGGCGSGLPLVLSEGEQQCYSEIFARCTGAAGGGPGSGPPEAARAPPGAATAAAGPVTELFRASQLPAETLHQVGPPAPVPLRLSGDHLCGDKGRGGATGLPTGTRRPWPGCIEGASQPRMAATPLFPGGHQPLLQLSSAGCAPRLPPLRGLALSPLLRLFLGFCSRPDPKFALFWNWCLFWLVSALTSASRSCPSLSWVSGKRWALRGPRWDLNLKDVWCVCL